MAVTLRYSTEFGKRSVAEFMQESIVVRVQCRRKESSRSLSHLLMSFLYLLTYLRIPKLYLCVSVC